MNKHEFCALTQALVDDALAFVDSPKGEDWKNHDMPDRQYRYIRLTPRRDIGKTFTGAWLSGKYDPTMWVFHSHDYKQDVIKRPWRHYYPPTNIDYAFSGEEVLHHNFFPRLGHDLRYGHQRTVSYPSRFTLGIIDEGSALEYRLGIRKKEEIIDRMFMCCKVVLELG